MQIAIHALSNMALCCVVVNVVRATTSSGQLDPKIPRKMTLKMQTDVAPDMAQKGLSKHGGYGSNTKYLSAVRRRKQQEPGHSKPQPARTAEQFRSVGFRTP